MIATEFMAALPQRGAGLVVAAMRQGYDALPLADALVEAVGSSKAIQLIQLEYERVGLPAPEPSELANWLARRAAVNDAGYPSTA